MVQREPWKWAMCFKPCLKSYRVPVDVRVKQRRRLYLRGGGPSTRNPGNGSNAVAMLAQCFKIPRQVFRVGALSSLGQLYME